MHGIEINSDTGYMLVVLIYQQTTIHVLEKFIITTSILSILSGYLIECLQNIFSKKKTSYFQFLKTFLLKLIEINVALNKTTTTNADDKGLRYNFETIYRCT